MSVNGGRAMSRSVRSLENLVVILPIGFESKKIMFALITFSAIRLCIFVDDSSMINCHKHDLIKTITTYPRIEPQNQYMYQAFSSFYYSSSVNMVNLDINIEGTS